MDATLAASGELGYRRVTIGEVIARAECRRAEFDACFDGLEESFAAAYAAESERLVERMLRSGSAPGSWRAGLRRALDELAEYVETRPLQTKALLVDAHLVAESVLERRQRVIERLSRALDSGRREDPRRVPPPLTSVFMVGAVEAAIVSALGDADPRLFRRAVPELEELIAEAYFRN